VRFPTAPYAEELRPISEGYAATCLVCGAEVDTAGLIGMIVHPPPLGEICPAPHPFDRTVLAVWPCGHMSPFDTADEFDGIAVFRRVESEPSPL